MIEASFNGGSSSLSGGSASFGRGSITFSVALNGLFLELRDSSSVSGFKFHGFMTILDRPTNTISDQRNSLLDETIELLERLKSCFRLGVVMERDSHAIVGQLNVKRFMAMN